MLKQTGFGLLVLWLLLWAGFALGQNEVVPEAVAHQGDQLSASVSITFGTDIDRQKRELIGQAEVFPAGIERITCLTQVQGLAVPNSVTHVWYRDGKTMARVDLNVASTNWRTWSSKRLLPGWTGHWEVKVLDSDGRVLGTAGFVVQ